SLAAAEIDAEARWIAAAGCQAAVAQCHAGGGESEQGVEAAVIVTRCCGKVAGKIEVLDLGREAGGKGGCIEARDRSHAALAGDSGGKQFLEGIAQRSDRSHARDDHTPPRKY